MKNVQKILFVGATLVLASCSFVSLNPDAKGVTVASDAKALSLCKFIGDTTVSLWSKADTFQSENTVDNQLDTLAKNEAYKMGGNAVTPDSKIVDGQRTYRVYNCAQK